MKKLTKWKSIFVVLSGLGLMLFVVFYFHRSSEATGYIQEVREKHSQLEVEFKTFSAYVVNGEIEQAYKTGSKEFQSATTLPTFKANYEDLNQRHGPLKTVKIVNIRVRGRGTPIKWVGHVEADLSYSHQIVKVMHEFHHYGNRWYLHGIKTDWR